MIFKRKQDSRPQPSAIDKPIALIQNQTIDLPKTNQISLLDISSKNLIKNVEEIVLKMFLKWKL